jgi:hypothetical protein
MQRLSRFRIENGPVKGAREDNGDAARIGFEVL